MFLIMVLRLSTYSETESVSTFPVNILMILSNFFFGQPVGLGKIAKLINEGQIDSHELITMKTLKVY